MNSNPVASSNEVDQKWKTAFSNLYDTFEFFPCPAPVIPSKDGKRKSIDHFPVIKTQEQLQEQMQDLSWIPREKYFITAFCMLIREMDLTPWAQSDELGCTNALLYISEITARYFNVLFLLHSYSAEAVKKYFKIVDIDQYIESGITTRQNELKRRNKLSSDNSMCFWSPDFWANKAENFAKFLLPVARTMKRTMKPVELVVDRLLFSDLLRLNTHEQTLATYPCCDWIEIAPSAVDTDPSCTLVAIIFGLSLYNAVVSSVIESIDPRLLRYHHFGLGRNESAVVTSTLETLVAHIAETKLAGVYESIPGPFVPGRFILAHYEKLFGPLSNPWQQDMQPPTVKKEFPHAIPPLSSRAVPDVKRNKDEMRAEVRQQKQALEQRVFGSLFALSSAPPALEPSPLYRERPTEWDSARPLGSSAITPLEDREETNVDLTSSWSSSSSSSSSAGLPPSPYSEIRRIGAAAVAVGVDVGAVVDVAAVDSRGKRRRDGPPERKHKTPSSTIASVRGQVRHSSSAPSGKKLGDKGKGNDGDGDGDSDDDDDVNDQSKKDFNQEEIQQLVEHKFGSFDTCRSYIAKPPLSVAAKRADLQCLVVADTFVSNNQIQHMSWFKFPTLFLREAAADKCKDCVPSALFHEPVWCCGKSFSTAGTYYKHWKEDCNSHYCVMCNTVSTTKGQLLGYSGPRGATHAKGQGAKDSARCTIFSNHDKLLPPLDPLRIWGLADTKTKGRKKKGEHVDYLNRVLNSSSQLFPMGSCQVLKRLAAGVPQTEDEMEADASYQAQRLMALPVPAAPTAPASCSIVGVEADDKRESKAEKVKSHTMILHANVHVMLMTGKGAINLAALSSSAGQRLGEDWTTRVLPNPTEPWLKNVIVQAFYMDQATHEYDVSPVVQRLVDDVLNIRVTASTPSDSHDDIQKVRKQLREADRILVAITLGFRENAPNVKYQLFNDMLLRSEHGVNARIGKYLMRALVESSSSSCSVPDLGMLMRAFAFLCSSTPILNMENGDAQIVTTFVQNELLRMLAKSGESAQDLSLLELFGLPNMDELTRLTLRNELVVHLEELHPMTPSRNIILTALEYYGKDHYGKAFRRLKWSEKRPEEIKHMKRFVKMYVLEFPGLVCHPQDIHDSLRKIGGHNYQALARNAFAQLGLVRMRNNSLDNRFNAVSNAKAEDTKLRDSVIRRVLQIRELNNILKYQGHPTVSPRVISQLCDVDPEQALEFEDWMADVLKLVSIAAPHVLMNTADWRAQAGKDDGSAVKRNVWKTEIKAYIEYLVSLLMSSATWIHIDMREKRPPEKKIDDEPVSMDVDSQSGEKPIGIAGDHIETGDESQRKVVPDSSYNGGKKRSRSAGKKQEKPKNKNKKEKPKNKTPKKRKEKKDVEKE